MLKRFFSNIKEYSAYINHAYKSELKSEVSNSHLNWIWWILEPLLFTLIYIFIVQVVFNTTEDYFEVFVIIGTTLWAFFEKCVKGSVKTIVENKDVITKVYIPKEVLVIIKVCVNVFKLGISFGLIALSMFIFNVPITLEVFNIILILIVLLTVVFGLASIITHFGVFVDDLSNVLNLVMKVLFYLSGIFYSVATRVPAPYGKLITYCNPIAYIINESRQVLVYGQSPNYIVLGGWFVIGCILSGIGLRLIYKYENSYVKVI